MNGDDFEVVPQPAPLLWRLMHDPVRGGRLYMGDLTGREAKAYALGKLAAQLILETHARISESMRGVHLDDSVASTVSSALRSAQRACGNADHALVVYDALIEYLNVSHDDAASPESSSDVVGLLRTVPPSLSTDSSEVVGNWNPHDDEPPSPTTAEA